MPRLFPCLLGCVLLSAVASPVVLPAAETPWQALFNGRDLTGWDTWLGPKSSGYLDPKTTAEPPLGLNHDPLGVFTVDTASGSPAIHVSGQVFGAITTQNSFENAHIRVEYRWGTKKWPPRDEDRHYRDTGILYWAIGPQGAGSYAWMRSVECNIMEKGVGQWWSVDGTHVDIEGRKVTLQDHPTIPYRGESPGEQCVVWEPGAPQFTTGEGITSPFDPERPADWNLCEVIAWGNVCLHLLNGEVVLALTNPGYIENGRKRPLTEGKIQLQSEGAEVFFRRVETRPVDEIPASLLRWIPKSAPDERDFLPLLTDPAATNWVQCGPGRFTVAEGVASAEGGMGLWWYRGREFTNFVLRGEFLQSKATADSGVFVRFPNPGEDPWVAVRRGHEFEIGDPAPENPNWRTGSLYPFKASTRANTHPPGTWNDFEVVCFGHNYSIRINGEVVTTWTDPERRSARGFIGLQNYDDGGTVRFRNLRIRDLPD
ncbi:MAG: DUF1080 domain-containing protein [Verrucomicrobiae bacterium]|nr:DUF1080 domain-containing protein [Verrucomicrobiae bacterium]